MCAHSACWLCILQVEEESGCHDMFDMANSQDTLEGEENGCHGDDGSADGDEDEPLGWTEEEKVLVQPGVQLVKVLPLTHTDTCTHTHITLPHSQHQCSE